MASPLAWLRPIDSEHSAIWQCLAGESMASVARLILTASGGPFLDATPEELALVTPELALRHPTWRMGAKITIDSATLANKGLEVIEAHWLYDVGYDAIDVVVHPQSVVHSAVVFVDGSLKAQLGTPDMRLPIQYALLYPHREPSPAAAPDLAAAASLTFRTPDEARFPALRIARAAGRIGSRATAALIAADEVAVERFLAGTLDFPGIPRLLEDAVGRYGGGPDQTPDVAALVALDAEIRDAFGSRGPGSARRRSAARARRMTELTGFVQSVITLVIFVFILGFLVVIHELGHFIVARLAGIRVLEFGIGFPPRAKVLRSEGETLYTLNWLPLGGFVKLEGEDGESDDPRSFVRAGLPLKLIILVAGVAMNVLLAVAIFTSIGWLPGRSGALGFQYVQAGSPAALVKLQGTGEGKDDQAGGQDPGHRRRAVPRLRQRTGDARLAPEPGGPLGRPDRPPRRRHDRRPDHQAALRPSSTRRTDRWASRASGSIPSRRPSPARRWTQPSSGWHGPGKHSVSSPPGLGSLGDAIVHRPTEAPPVQGPVGIAVGVGDVFWQQGPIATLFLAGLLSANLALVNILPLPPLDGGRMFVLILKTLVGKRLSLKAEQLTYLVGFGFLMLFLAWITFFDIARQIGGGQ